MYKYFYLLLLNKGYKQINIKSLFLKKFRFARIWGKSVKHDGTNTGLDHILKDEDVVELHLK
ncbi:TGS domain-containing protein [archaeon]|nr:TGS domain-containing protein [archaeon]